MDNSLVEGGLASIADVRRKNGMKVDNMESCVSTFLFNHLAFLTDRISLGFL